VLKTKSSLRTLTIASNFFGLLTAKLTPLSTATIVPAVRLWNWLRYMIVTDAVFDTEPSTETVIVVLPRPVSDAGSSTFI
jgi:hypothetical protein